MSGGSGSGNQVTRIEPPSYQLPHLQRGLAEAQNRYQVNSASGGVGNVIPFSQQTEQALQMQQDRAISGSPVARAAQDYAQFGLGGGFLGSNPYLDDTFRRAALGTQNQLASEFARSGRNVGASEGLRSQQLGDLATSIYGGAYENERNRQQQLVGQAGGLAQLDYNDIGALRDVGSQVEGLAGEYNDAPDVALDQYLGRISGSQFGQNQITPTYRNRTAGALGGAATGAGIGSMFGPLGTGAGAILGGIFGGL